MSFVPRLFLPLVPPDRDEILLEESASRYLVKVLRFTEGSRFSGFDPQGNRYELRLAKADPSGAAAQVVERREREPRESRLSLTLAQSLPKSSKMDLILRQATEAGAHRFIPLLTQRSVSRPDLSRYGHKDERWRKILVESCRQCGRNDLPVLERFTDWEHLLGRFGEFDTVLLPYEKEAPSLKTVLEAKSAARSILILVGPEGGWSREELEQAGARGAAPVHLPTPILRTETAGIVALSMIQFFYGSEPGGET
jgi:16S rRNA (uracil1498-N3)-methyltransferase